ncbi:ATP-dependent DNA ligase [Saxibacter everestensis]|uniref:DNA ligase (ATP) n=1 Tax=Saxibacter everestensis TaxID=2909229 RepID=A0ABY8QUV9_9MICO|nr:ATP-dependent DNA ligase [Brevibacteriaceae bacterium ZFBP1038]
MARTTQVKIGGHRLGLTHLDKVLYAETGTTKADVLRYYAEIAELAMPHLLGRPVTQKRWPDGTDQQPFFQKNLADSTPDWIDRVSLEHSDRIVTYPLVTSPATLAWFGQNAALELHTPQWRINSKGEPGNPDRLVLDLDPGDGVTLADCAKVALEARGVLADHGLDGFPLTSGSKGIHLYCALSPNRTSEQISELALDVARILEERMPETVLSKMKRSLRGGKVFVDWSQNNSKKTTIAPYSLRGRDQPTVAAPRSWDELEDPELAQLTYDQVLERAARDGDLLQALTRKNDRLATYRSMRDAAKTPEPVPDGTEDNLPHGNDDTFVIQEHHARRLHWDFRLEHDGVLVSWALPKGVPETTKKNNLAVHTEDHPLDYASFDGTIPKGEYGGGEVTIWDRGSYELEKWRKDEVIVILHGQRATGRYVLFQTDGKNWMIHRTKDQPDIDVFQPKDASQPRQPGQQSDAATAQPKRKVADAPGPMLAQSGELDDIDDMRDWAFEMKWDGVRAIAHIRNGSVQLLSRNGNDVTAQYPEFASLAGSDGVAGLPHDTVLDGEIVAFGSNGAPDFGRLQQRMKLSNPEQIKATGVRVHLMLFDLLRLDGESLLRKSWEERRAALIELQPPGDAVQIPSVFLAHGHKAMETSAKHYLEGVIAKRRDSSYQPSRRSGKWIKVKHEAMQEVVVVGWRPGAGRRAGGVGSLLVAVYDDGELRYAGRVGTGFSDAALAESAERFRPLARKTSPVKNSIPAADAKDAHWVRPSLVGEVSYANWTSDGRLRQPSWRGFRPDKDATDVVIESSGRRP